jgi:hypothetical protein
MGNYPQTTLLTARNIRDKYKDLIKQGIDSIEHNQKEEDKKRIQLMVFLVMLSQNGYSKN